MVAKMFNKVFLIHIHPVIRARHSRVTCSKKQLPPGDLLLAPEGATG